jgi:hypothetical protein
MNWMPDIDTKCPEAGNIDEIETLIVPRSRDLGWFEVRRALVTPSERTSAQTRARPNQPLIGI